MSLTPLYTYVDQNRETFINRLIDYVRRPSISAYGEGMGEVADYLLKWLNEMNFNAHLVPTKGWDMVLGRRNDAPNAPTVLLQCRITCFDQIGERFAQRCSNLAS